MTASLGARRRGRTTPRPAPEDSPLLALMALGEGAETRIEQQLLDLLTPRLPGKSATLTAVEAEDPTRVALLAAAARHRQAAQALLDASLAKNTRRTYASHVRAWARWCIAYGACPLPAEPQQVMAFLAAYVADPDPEDEAQLTQRRATASVEVRAAALAKIHHNAGHPSPTDDPIVQELLAGVRRTFHVKPKHAKGAIDRKLLAEAVTATAAPRPQDMRRWALILLRARTGLSVAALRRLHWADIDIDDQAAHISLDLGGGQCKTIRVAKAQDARVCLVTALEHARQAAPHLGYVAVRDDGTPLSRQAIHQALRECEVAAGCSLPDARTGALLRARNVHGSAGRGAAVRNVALLTVGWWAALRRSELTGLLWSHLTRRADGGWVIFLPSSKTDQEGAGCHLYLPRLGQGLADCPARALDAWHAYISDGIGGDPRRHPDLPVFARLDRAGKPSPNGGQCAALTEHAVNLIVQAVMARCGREATGPGGRNLWGAHSLRAGFVTEALRDDKLTPVQVQEITRHKSIDVLLRYRRELRGFANSPVHQLVSALDLAA